ncbi:MAG: glycosyltransferase [Candidatus Aenigmarchaeota archaeon]|nr:glycosyltransferase [Candidatus Aenigmarchaeota archaeon]
MKIAFFTDTYEPQINGVVTSINAFAKCMERHGNTVSIFCPSPGGNHKKNIFTFPSIDFSRYPGYRIGIPVKKIKNFDVFHVHTPFSVGLAGVAAARFHKKPVVGTFHTLIPEFTDYFIKTRRFKALLKKAAWRYSAWFYNMCDVVIAPSPEIRTLLKRHGIRKRIVVVPTGIEKPEKIRKERLRKKYKFPENSKIILHVGRISKEKNIDFILTSLKNKPDNWTLIIASDGPEKKNLKELASYLGIKNVIFTGFISKEKLNGLYFLADVLVVASKSETQGIVVAEAAARGLSVVSLDAPVIANFIRKNKAGIVAREKNFLSSIKKALEKNKPAAMKGCTIEETTKSLLNIYKSLSPSGFV